MRQKELIELSATGVLIVVMIFAFGNAAKKSRLRNMKNIKPKAADLTLKPAIQEVRTDSINLYNVLEEQAKSFDLKRDPFTATPIISERTLQSGVDLTGILWDRDKPLAIIDGDIVKKGARVGTKTIVDIKKDRVILSDGVVFSELKLE